MVAINMRMLKSLPQYNPGSALNLPKALLIEKLKTSRQPGMNNQSQSAAISFQTATLPDAPVLASFVRKYYEFDGIAFVRDQVESGLNTLLADAEGNSRISAEDYAIAFVDELEQGRFVRQIATVAY